MRRHHRRSSVLAMLTIAGLVGAACADDDDDDSEASAPSGTDALVEGSGASTSAPATSGAPSTEPATTASTASTAPSTTTAEIPTFEPGPGEHHLDVDEGEPVRGGTLVYGLEADSANGWAPYRTSCATSCYIPLSAVSDPLFAYTDDGVLTPAVAESVEANADHTEWTITVRDGIRFHDGTPLDGAAVKFNIDTCRFSPLTGAAYAPIADVQASGQTVTLTVEGGPWVVLPAYFAGSQCGYMFSPAWLGSLADIPQRNQATPVYDAALAATPADGDPAKPVGLGAFVFESYTPGNGNAFRAVRNDDYWRGPNGITGEQLPYLDAIEAVVAVDVESRSNGLRSDQFDIIHSANADTIAQYVDDDDYEVIATSRFGETSYILLNVAAGDLDPAGKNAASPLLNVHCRRALAHAIDQQRVADERGAGLVEPANGPFPAGSVGYLDDTGYPTYDLDAAAAEMDACLGELGTDTVEFTFNTTNDPFNIESNALIESMWKDAFGDTVKPSITPIEQGAYIGLALTGAFNALGARGFSGLDPDQQRVWWQTSSAAPIDALALNAGRIVDPDMEAALTMIKTNPDPAVRRAAAETVNKIFGEQVYEWWLTTTLWGVIEHPYVNGVEGSVLPDGTPGTGLVGAGRHGVAQLWCDEGICE